MAGAAPRALLLVVVLLAAGCGGGSAGREPDRRGLATGLAEGNPHLIAPGPVPAGFARPRDRASALRPAFFRLLVDWSKVQPRAAAPPDWTAAADGCMRGRPPCGAYAGIRDVLRAVRARQDADGGWQVVVSVHGAPDWARRPAEGCGGGRPPDTRAYRALVRSLQALGREQGVALGWWSAWNEPNHPTFLGPQRAACDVAAAPRSPGIYAGLVRALRAELGPGQEVVIGELAGYDRPRPRALGAAEFARALPRDVACAGRTWAQHAYVDPGEPGAGPPSGEPGAPLAGDPGGGASLSLMADVLAALDAKDCPVRHRVWVTETGVGGPRTGRVRPTGAAALAEGCRAIDGALRAWGRHPRVDAAFQYTFREDPAFPVGLTDPRLERLYAPYAAWRAWGRPGAVPARPCA